MNSHRRGRAVGQWRKSGAGQCSQIGAALLWLRTGLWETQFTLWSKGTSGEAVLIVLPFQGCYWKVLLVPTLPKFSETPPDGSALQTEYYRHYPWPNTDFFPNGKVFCEECCDSFCEILVFSANRKIQSKEATAIWKLLLPTPSKILARSDSNYNLW